MKRVIEMLSLIQAEIVCIFGSSKNLKGRDGADDIGKNFQQT